MPIRDTRSAYTAQEFQRSSPVASHMVSEMKSIQDYLEEYSPVHGEHEIKTCFDVIKLI